MLATILNLLYGCRHRRITRPITPYHRPGTLAGATYVACLDCGKQFHYDVANMRMGTIMPSPAVSHRSASGAFQVQA